MLGKVLDGLKDIDWSGLGLPEIRQWLTDLTSDSKEVRLRAYHNLEDKVVDPGNQTWENYGPISETMRTDAPFLIVPFLIELLEQEDVKNKEWILQLLSDLASQVWFNTGQLEEPYKARALQVYRAVRKGFEKYKALAESGVSPLREYALELLSIFDPANLSPNEEIQRENEDKLADYLIDLGPEGGDAGGYIIATGTSEEIAQNPDSFTGQFLRSHLNSVLERG